MSWAPFVILTVLAILVVAIPMLRRRKPPVSRADYDLQVYRDQIRELEEDLERGILTKDQEAAARLEIDRRILGVSDRPYRRPGTIAPWQVVAALVVLIPATSVGLYLMLGAPGTLDQPLADRPLLAAPPAIPQELLDFVEEQEAHQAANPEDAQGWVMLGRAHLATGQFQGAADAFRTAIGLGIDDADTQMNMVEALFNTTGGFVTAEAQAAVAAALEDDPVHPGARFYQGIAHSQAGRMQEAFDTWLALAADTPVEASWMPFLRQALEDAATVLNLDLAELMPPPAPPPPRSPLEEMTQEEQIALIESMVARLAERLEQEPEDLEGWVRLSQSYRVLNRMEEARQAIDRAVALAPTNVEALVQQANLILSKSADGAVPAEATAVLRRALELEPDNADALFVSGSAHAAAGAAAAARADWVRLLSQLDPGGSAHAQIQARIDALPVE